MSNKSDKEKAFLAYHKRLNEVFDHMESKKEPKPMFMQRVTVSAASLFAGLQRLFTRAAERCTDIEIYFLAKSSKYRR